MSSNWHKDVFFGLHFDLHAGEHDTDLGAETTYRHIRAELEKVGVDWVQYDCKGHPGYTGYPTKVGTPSPGIVKDALKIWSEVAHDMGIPIVVHYSGTWDGVQWKLHPDWSRRRADGSLVGGEGWNPYALAADCPYDEQIIIPQLTEVIDWYDIDGCWVDGECWAAAPDWSAWSTDLFTKETGITDIPHKPEDPHWAEFMAFNRRRFEAHIQRYADALHARKPAFTICSNWAYTARMPDEVSVPVDYLSGDFTWAFGLDNATLEAKFMDSRGLPWDLMAWGFTTSGSMAKARWTTKSFAHLAAEGALVAANGGAFQIYDTPVRNGRVVNWHMDVFAEVGKFMRARQPICQGTTSAAHVALLHSESHFYANNHPENTVSIYNEGVPVRTLTGALALLLDNHYHADVMNEETLLRRIDQYPVVVVAEQTHLPQALKDALLAWVKRGGKLLLTGSHIVADYGGDVLGVTAEGEPGEEVVFVPADGEAVNVSGSWQHVKTAGARALAPLLKTQEVKRGVTGFPSATIKKVGRGSIAAIYGPVSTVYGDYRYPRIRSFAGNVLKALTGTMPVEIDAPAYVQLTVRQRDNQLIVHLLNTASENPLAPVNPYVEAVPTVGPINVRVQCPARPKVVTLAPDNTGLTWKWSKGLLTATIEALHIHSALVIDLKLERKA
jgi:Hypothetical glycosyl hydrolase 6